MMKFFKGLKINNFNLIGITILLLVLYAQSTFALTLDLIAKIKNVATPKSVRVSPNGDFAIINSL